MRSPPNTCGGTFNRIRIRPMKKRPRKLTVPKTPRQVTTKRDAPLALRAEDAPGLAELWDNEEDAIYDTLADEGSAGKDPP